MLRDPKLLLWDVSVAAEAIERVIVNISFDDYVAMETIHSTVERKFEIIGEALNKLRKIDPTLAAGISDIGRIIGLRNLLIHGYAFVEHARVWQIVQDELPKLRATVQSMLDA